MKRSFFRLLLLPSAFVLAACGAAATLSPEGETPLLSDRLSEAGWYAERGDHPGLASAADGILLEDSSFHGGSIAVLSPGDDSTYVNGAFTINVPDRDVVKLSAKVGLPNGATGTVLFRAFVQNGADFPKLAEVAASADGHLDEFSVDLSPFRGRAVLLILAVSSPDQSPLTTPALWVEPKILTP